MLVDNLVVDFDDVCEEGESLDLSGHEIYEHFLVEGLEIEERG